MISRISNGYRCSSTCQIESGFTCGVDLIQSISICIEICGDGLDMGQYQCDDGNKISGDGCSSTCNIESGYYCQGGSPSTRDYCLPYL